MVQMAEGPSRTPPLLRSTPGALDSTTSRLDVAPTLERTESPDSFTQSKAKYQGNFTTVSANAIARRGTPEDVGKFESKKSEWYTRWGTAALQTNGDLAQGEFVKLESDLQTLFPDDAPSAGGGHLYTGYADEGSGRERAEAADTEGNSAPETPERPKLTHRTLERTLMGNLFDGVAGGAARGASADDQRQWIPYTSDVVGQWWSLISASFANTFVGAVNAHVDIGFPYFVGKVVESNRGASLAALTAPLQALIQLDRSVFRDDELPRIATLMAEGLVTTLNVNLRIEVCAGDVRTHTLAVPGRGITDAAGIVTHINTYLQSAVSAEDLKRNIVPETPDETSP